MDERGPETVTRWIILSSAGARASDWRDREAGAWANAAHRIGGPAYNRRNKEFDLEAQKAFIESLKAKGYRAEKVEKVSTRETRNVTAKKGIDEYLHVRFSDDDLIALDKLRRHFATKHGQPTKSWVVRKLLYAAVAELKL